MAGPLLCFCAGTAWGKYHIIVVPAFLLVSASILLFFQFGNSFSRQILLFLGSLLLFFFFLGWARYEVSINHFEQANSLLFDIAGSGRSSLWTGQIIRAPEPTAGGTRLTVGLLDNVFDSKNNRNYGIIRLTVKGLDYAVFGPGDLIRFNASLRKVENFHTPGAWDYETYMALKGIGVTGYVDSLAKIEIVGHASSSPHMNRLRYVLERMRYKTAIAMQNGLRTQGLGIAAALVIGQRGFLSDGARELFSKAGLGHLLAVSGLHMGLLAAGTGGMVYFFLVRWPWLALRIRVRKIAVAVSALSCLVYAGFAGFSPSALRAAVMFLFLAMAVYADKPMSPLHALSLSAWCLLLYDPLYLFSIGFQLSYAATFFILLLLSSLNQPGHGHALRKRRIVLLILVTATAFAATSPLTLYHFQRISTAGPLLNLLFVPAVSLTVLPLLLTGTLFSFFSEQMASVAWSAAGLLIKGMVDLLARLPLDFLTFWYPRPWQWQVILSYLLLLTIFLTLNQSLKGVKRFHVFLFPAVMIFCLFLATFPLQRAFALRHQGGLKFHVLDVGQGTCQVVLMPGGRVMVVDAGGLRSSLDVGKVVVAPFLRSLGVQKIDVLALSHPELDHMGGMAALFDQFPIAEFWTSQDHGRSPVWPALVEKAKQAGSKWVVWTRPGTREFGSAQVEVIPSKCTAIPFHDRNNRSLLFRLRFNGVEILLTGDIEHEREECLVRNGLRPVDVLVVPHHGSKTSSSTSFLEAVRPRIAVVPVGRHNFLGLPNGDVLRSYDLIRAEVFRTDLDGTVSIETDGRAFTVSTYNGTCSGKKKGSLVCGREPGPGHRKGCSWHQVWQHGPS